MSVDGVQIWDTPAQKTAGRRGCHAAKPLGSSDELLTQVSGTAHAPTAPMQKMELHQLSHFSVLSVFAIMTKVKRPFLTPPVHVPAPAGRFFNQ